MSYGQPYNNQPPLGGYQNPPQPYAYGYNSQPQPTYSAQPGYNPQPGYTQPAYNNTGYGAQPQAQPYYSDTQPLASGAPVEPASERTSLSSSVKFPDQYHWRDLPFAVLFYLHLAGIVALFIGGYSNYKNQSKDEEDDDIDFIPLKDAEAFSSLFTIVIICAAVGILFSFGYLAVVKKFAKQLIYGTLLANIFLWLAFALVMFAVGQVFSGIIFLVIAGLNGLCFYFWRHRIPFASAMLKTVAGIIDDFPATTYTAYASLIVLIAWFFFWVATVSFAQTFTSAGIVFFFLLLSFYWTSQVIKNVVHVTVAGTHASWYFLRATGMPHNPTVGALKRALTTSFGSICLGSLIVAFLKTLKALAEGAKSKNNNLLTCLLACIVSCLESLIRYFNMYAFTQVAIYGKTYCEAAKDTWELIKSHGIQAIINDNLISNVLLLGAFLGGAITALTGGIIGYAWASEYWVGLAVTGFIIGFVMSMLTMEVVESGVTCIFVCFAMDPAALKRADPFLYQKFSDTYGHHFSFA